MSSRMEAVFETICVYMGANVFKKYWPDQGSWWNRRNNHPRINKNSNIELGSIITDAHLQNILHLLHQTFLFGYYIIMRTFKVDPDISSIFLMSFSICNFYGLMIHQYNIILAQRQIYSNRKKQAEIAFNKFTAEMDAVEAENQQ